MPVRCCTVLSALRSAVSRARAFPSSRIRSVPGVTCAPSSTSISIRTSGSSARKNASAIGRPAIEHASRASITPENRAFGRNDAGRGNIAAAARQADAQILVQSGADKRGKVETWKREIGHYKPLPRSPSDRKGDCPPAGARSEAEEQPRGRSRGGASEKQANARSAPPHPDMTATPSPLRPNPAPRSIRRWYAA